MDHTMSITVMPMDNGHHEPMINNEIKPSYMKKQNIRHLSARKESYKEYLEYVLQFGQSGHLVLILFLLLYSPCSLL